LKHYLNQKVGKMRHLSYSIKNIKELEEILSSTEIKAQGNSSSILVQVFSANTDEEWIEEATSSISKRLPQAVIVGATTVGEVIFGKTYTNSTAIGFSFFDITTLHVISKECDTTQEFDMGKVIVNEISTIDEHIAGVLLLSTPLNIDVASLLEGIKTSESSYPIFGAGAGNYSSMDNSLVFSNQWIKSKGAVAVVFTGEELQIDYRTYLGWKPLSQEMTITKVEGMLVKTIDNRPAFEVYDKYLGLPNDESFFLNVLEFPVLLQRDGEELARVPVFVDEDGGIQFVADIHEGEKIRIGYGDPDLIINDSAQMHQLVQKFQPEAIFLFTCGCRRFLMQELVELETAPFQKVAPTFGFYTYGEFLGTPSNLQLLNSTMVIVSFREGKTKIFSNSSAKIVNDTPKDSSDPYLNKHGRIISRLVHFVEAVTSELAEKNVELNQLYVTDQLTGLYNRHKLDEVLLYEFDRVQRYKASLGLIILDIDHFKEVNDTYGHQVGDDVLSSLSKILRDNARKSDTVGRWGGEEFLIICPESDLKGLIQYAEKLRKLIEGFPFDKVGHKTSCFGLAMYQEGDTIETIISKADKALYKAKNSGRNRVESVY